MCIEVPARASRVVVHDRSGSLSRSVRSQDIQTIRYSDEQENHHEPCRIRPFQYMKKMRTVRPADGNIPRTGTTAGGPQKNSRRTKSTTKYGAAHTRQKHTRRAQPSHR